MSECHWMIKYHMYRMYQINASRVGLIFCYVMRWCSYICKCIK